MARPKIDICKRCLKRFDHLSAKRLCFNCSMSRVNENISSLMNKSGKPYENWKAKLKESLDREDTNI